MIFKLTLLSLAGLHLSGDSSDFRVREDRPRKTAQRDRGSRDRNAARDRKSVGAQKEIPSLLSANTSQVPALNFQTNTNPLAMQIQQQVQQQVGHR